MAGARGTRKTDWDETPVHLFADDPCISPRGSPKSAETSLAPDDADDAGGPESSHRKFRKTGGEVLVDGDTVRGQSWSDRWRERVRWSFVKREVRTKTPVKSAKVERKNSNVERITELLEQELHLDDLRNLAEEPFKHWLVDSRPFSFVVNCVIIVNSLQLGACTRTHVSSFNFGDDWDGTCAIMDQAFLAFFSGEAILRLSVYRLSYFAYGWHWLDLTVLFVGYFEILINSGLNLNGFRTLRVLRVFRLLRLLRLFKDLWVIIEGLLASLKPTVWICLLMLMELYIFSLVCVDTIGSEGIETYPGFSIQEADILALEGIATFNNYQFFGTIPRSMYTLFNVIIGAEWPEIGRPIWERQPAIFFLFAFFIICTMFGLMNVLIGVIVDNTKCAQTRLEREDMNRNKARKAKCLSQLCEFVFSLDFDKDGAVTLEDIQRGFEKRDITPLLSIMDLPHGFTAEELFHLFNFNGGDDISDGEFVAQAYRLIYGTSFHHQYQLMAGINEVKFEISKMATRLEDVEERQVGIMRELASVRQVRPEARTSVISDVESGDEAQAEDRPARSSSFHGPSSPTSRTSSVLPRESAPLQAPAHMRRQLEDLVASSQALLAQMDEAQTSGIASGAPRPTLSSGRQSQQQQKRKVGSLFLRPPSSEAPIARTSEVARRSTSLDQPRELRRSAALVLRPPEQEASGGSSLRAAASASPSPSPTASASLSAAQRTVASVNRPFEEEAVLPVETPPALPNTCQAEGGGSPQQQHRQTGVLNAPRISQIPR